MKLVNRLVALAVILAVVGALRPDLVDRLRVLFWPATPAAVTEVTRPDLSPGPESGIYQPPDEFVAHQFDFAGQSRRFYALPASGQAGLPPLVLLLHGAGRDGSTMLDMWQAVAGQGVFLLAPDAMDKDVWNPDKDGPAFLTALLDQARLIQPFDPDRIYVFGHSAGANMALYLGACTGFPARAIALHAGALVPCPGVPTPHPYLIQIGDQDASFPLSAVRASAEALATSGSPVMLQIIPGHSHWYYDIGPALAAEAWTFLQAQP